MRRLGFSLAIVAMLVAPSRGWAANACQVGASDANQLIQKILRTEDAPAARDAAETINAAGLSPSAVKSAMKDLTAANGALARAVSHSDDPAGLVAELKQQIPPGNGLMRVVSPEEAETIIKDGGIGRGYDFGLTPEDARLGHGGNFIVVRCRDCSDVRFAPGELGSSRVNMTKIPAGKLEFIVLKPPTSSATSAIDHEVEGLSTAGIIVKDPRSLPAYGLNDDERVASAERGLREAGLVKGELSPEQRTLIHDHLGAGQDTDYFMHSKTELRQKLVNATRPQAPGEAAPFTMKQADYLIRNGYAGSPRTLSTGDSTLFKSVSEVKPGSAVRAQVLYTDAEGQARVVSGNLIRDPSGSLRVEPFSAGKSVKFGKGPGEVSFGMARPFESKPAWAWTPGKPLSSLNSIPEGSDYVVTLKFRPGSTAESVLQYQSWSSKPFTMTKVQLDKIGTQFTIDRRVGSTIYLRNAAGWEIPVNVKQLSGAASEIQSMSYQAGTYLGTSMQ